MNTDKTPGHIKLDEKNHVCRRAFSGAAGGLGLDCYPAVAETEPAGFVSVELCRGGTPSQTAGVARKDQSVAGTGLG